MSDLRPVRGTHDIFGDEALRHRHVAETARRIAARFGYGTISTPVFEFTHVFARTLGDTSDIVTKEMYTFEDRSGDSLTLRPENTAGIARALVSNGLRQHLPVRFFACGPMFRHERPQKGRLRQFHQIDIELLGAPEPMGDAEVIAVGQHVLDELGIADKVKLELNTLGDPESRTAYRERLVAYFEGHRGRLSEDSLARLERNPLRILDSKDEGDREVIHDAPRMSESLNEHSQAFFASVREALDALGIAYVLNERLVRGLDYYTHTAFEFTTDQLGAQGAVIAGGRYDGLVGQMGGPETPGVGWAAGIERLSMLVAPPEAEPRPIAVVPIGDDTAIAALRLADELRRGGFRVDMALRGRVGQRLKRASRVGARYALLLGSDEMARDAVQLRDLDQGEQSEIARRELIDALGRGSG